MERERQIGLSDQEGKVSIHPSFIVAGSALSIVGAGFLYGAEVSARSGDIQTASLLAQTGVGLLVIGVLETINRILDKS